MKVRVHYPQTEEGMQRFKKQLAHIHAQLIVDYIVNLDCSDDEKRSLLNRAIYGPGQENTVVHT